ncbi:hypothetical protein D3C78_1325560 [compost metagenome]
MRLDIKLDLVQQILNVLDTEVFGPRAIRLAAVQGLAVAQLKLDAVGTGIKGCINQALGKRKRTVVIVAHLRDHENTGPAHQKIVDMDASHWIFVRHEVTPLDSKRKFCVWQPSSDSAFTTR